MRGTAKRIPLHTSAPALVGLSLFLIATTGCGDDTVPVDAGQDAPMEDGPVSDGGADAGDGGGGDTPAVDGGPRACEAEALLVTTSDFTNGQRGLVNRATGESVPGGENNVDQDTVAGAANFSLDPCTPFLLARAQGLLHVQSPDAPLDTASTIDLNPNPEEAEPYAVNPLKYLSVSATKGYVLLGAGNDVAIVDPQAGTVTGRIDLSIFLKPTDMDGSINVTDGVLADGRLYVALGNYWFDDSITIQFAGSSIAVIDVATDTLVDFDETTDGIDDIELRGENPWRGLVHDAPRERLLVGAAGDSFAIDGAIEAVDLTDGSTEIVVREEDLGAELNGLMINSVGRLWVIAGDNLVTLNLDAGAIVMSTVRESVVGIVDGGGVFYSWGAGEDPGIRAHDPVTELDVTPGGAAITVGELPIYSIALSPGAR